MASQSALIEAPRRPRVTAADRSAALQQSIMDLILDRGLRPGDPLPTELELVDELGVGRNTVREALKVLQAIGVVEVRHGYGTFVARNQLDALAVTLTFHARMSLVDAGKEAEELVDVRQALESELIASAITAHDAESLAQVREQVEAMESCAAAGQPIVEADRAFHRALFAPLENHLLSKLLDMFWSAYSGLHQSLPLRAQTLEETAREHRKLYTAVAQKNAEVATSLMRKHFEGIRGLIQQAVGH